MILSFALGNFACSQEAKFPFLDSKVIQTESKFTDKTPQNIKITEDRINLPTKEILKEVFFNRENIAFIGNKFTGKNERQRTFFKTSDGGKSWQDYRVNIPETLKWKNTFANSENLGFHINTLILVILHENCC